MATLNNRVPVVFVIEGLGDLKTANAELQRMNGTVPKSAKQIRNLGHHTTNAANQISDLIVQIEMGQDPFRALAQQLPQILSGFRGLAVAGGIIATSVLPIIIRTLAKTTDSFEELEDGLEASNAAMSQFNQVMRLSENRAEQWQQAIRESHRAVREEILQTAQLTQIIAVRDREQEMESLRAAAEQLIRATGDMRREFVNAGKAFNTSLQDLDATEVAIFGLAREMDTTEENARKVVMAMQALSNPALAPEDAARIMRQLMINTGLADERLQALLDAATGISVLQKDIKALDEVIVSPNGNEKLEEIVVSVERIGEAAKNFMTETQALTTENNGIEWFATTGDKALEAFNKSFKTFTDNIVAGNQSISDSFKQMAKSVIADVTRMYATQFLYGAFGLTPAAKGAVMDGGKMTAFAKGGVVSSPTIFPMKNGAGLMGEAGPEAIMPLRRLPNGDLGVQSGGAGVVINNYSGANVQAQQTSEGMVIDILMDQMAGAVRQGGNNLSSALEDTFALNRGRGLY